jgi:hypothetical protein
VTDLIILAAIGFVVVAVLVAVVVGERRAHREFRERVAEQRRSLEEYYAAAKQRPPGEPHDAYLARLQSRREAMRPSRTLVRAQDLVNQAYVADAKRAEQMQGSGLDFPTWLALHGIAQGSAATPFESPAPAPCADCTPSCEVAPCGDCPPTPCGSVE